MSASDEPEREERERTLKAVQIIRRLDENPDDKDAQKDRDAFLQNGDRERATYNRTLRALGRAETSLKRGRSRRQVVGLLVAMLTILAFAGSPVKLAITADFQSARGVGEVVVASGDTLFLDAGSAISDETDGAIRSVTLMAGAGYFDVDTSEQSFVVRIGDVTVETLGTAFEVSLNGDTSHVSVAEGAVAVRQDDVIIEVQAGERLRWRDTLAAQPEDITMGAVGAWRGDLLITDGMTVGEVAAIVGRRLRGTTLVMSQDLSRTVVSGRLDLSRPADALRTLVATVDADLIIASPLGAVIYP